MPSHITLVQYISAELFLLTGLLLWFATRRSASGWGRAAAWSLLFTVCGAIYFMLVAYTGEPALDLQSTNGIIRRAVASSERGYFTFVGDEGAQRGRSGGQSGLLHKAMWGGADAANPRDPGTVLRDCPDCPEMVIVQAGYFRMGADASDTDATENERPRRLVRINASFAIGRHEITVGQFQAFSKATGRALPACIPARNTSDPRLPIACVSAQDAHAYTRWLREKTGLAYRLPSESEWEYAARGGVQTRFVTGQTLPRDAAKVGLWGARLNLVGSYAANGYGLHDVHGNVAEITADCWTGSVARLPGDGTAAGTRFDCSRRALRDATAEEPAKAARLSARRPIPVDARLPGVGFRVVRDLK